jgi:protocatechuate 3,4-dioxygenase beta subunit
MILAMKPQNLPLLGGASPISRRRVLTRLASGVLVWAGGVALAEAFYTTRGAFAEALTRTAGATEGPFYPYGHLPLDTDNDLIVVGNDTTPAVGVVSHVGGRLLDARGEPVRNATIEIWQADSNAVYLAERDRRRGEFDSHFQGYGRFETASDGAYRFRTIKPVPYPGRPAPHIHFKITAKGRRPWTTQLFIKGHPGNIRDGVYRSIGDAAARETVTREFAALADSRAGELAATLDIVLSVTPEG